VRVEADRELLAPCADVWQLLSEPYHLSDWWPGYTAIRPDRRGLTPGARWTVVRSSDPGLLRRPGGEGLIVIGEVEERLSLSWHDLAQGFAAEIRLEPAGERTRARVTVDAPWWRILVEGLRDLPRSSLGRLNDLCQTAAGL
jgi:uncharacterized protein YndB with AHSA1/START domain